jgi:hypothetical protein
VRKDFIMPVNKERHEMVGNVILGLSMIASAFRLKAPLPPYLPPAEQSRQKLVSGSLLGPSFVVSLNQPTNPFSIVTGCGHPPVRSGQESGG